MLPSDSIDTATNHVLATVVVLLIWGWVLVLLLRVFRRSRPELRVGDAIAVGYALRVVSIAAIAATGLGDALRGGDESGFILHAHQLASRSFTASGWAPFGANGLHVQLFAAQFKIGDLTVDAVRISQVGIATVGSLLIIVAAYDLAGGKAARLTAWLLALEPASIFFSEVLHKEPNLLLATGLVAFGGARLWKRITPSGLVLMGVGGIIAVATRPYAGWFLIAAGVVVLLHASVLHARETRGRSAIVIVGIAAVLVVVSPAVLTATSGKNLNRLQVSQQANTTSTGTPGNNLALEKVDFSSPAHIVTNLPIRIRDLVLRPWPWQLGNNSQRIGALGTLVAYCVLYFFVVFAVRMRGQVFRTAGPLLYPMFGLMVAYALSVGNAGTGFRYRTHLVGLALASIVVLRERWLAERAPQVALRTASHVGSGEDARRPLSPGRLAW